MGYYYAQLNNKNICNGVSDLSGEIFDDNLVRLETYDLTVLGKHYNNGVWEEVPQPEPEPSQLDRIEEQLKLTYTEAQEQAVDAYTEKLIEEGTL